MNKMKIKDVFILCMSDLSACVYMHHMCACKGQKRDRRELESRLAVSHHVPVLGKSGKCS